MGSVSRERPPPPGGVAVLVTQDCCVGPCQRSALKKEITGNPGRAYDHYETGMGTKVGSSLILIQVT